MNAAAEHPVAVVEHERLPGRDRRHRLVERELDLVAVDAHERRRHRARAVAHLHLHLAPNAGTSASQLTPRATTPRPSSASRGPITTARSAGRIATTNIGSAKPPGSPRRCPTVKRACPSCSPTTRRRASRTAPARAPARRRRAPADDLRVVAVGHEADVLALDLVGDHREPEPRATARVSAFVRSPTGRSMRAPPRGRRPTGSRSGPSTGRARGSSAPPATRA
jgi:hypothetical protein